MDMKLYELYGRRIFCFIFVARWILNNHYEHLTLLNTISMMWVHGRKQDMLSIRLAKNIQKQEYFGYICRNSLRSSTILNGFFEMSKLIVRIFSNYYL